MTSDRRKRQIDSLLDEAEAAIRDEDWTTVRQRVRAVLALEPDNLDALAYAAAADRAAPATDLRSTSAPVAPPASAGAQPTSFANGRYTVKRFLGEGGKKRVYLAHDSLLDRDVAFALIKTEGLDAAARERVTREAQAMGRLGAHPHIVTVFDIGEEDGQPYLVLPVLAGGDVEGVIEKAPDGRLPLEQAIKIATETCRSLEFVHAKGIVHRDLKPGNVWLTEDGRAMIGDFGLAIAMDRSRLTQAGMMVGTVNYMPPEQAMGGQMDARSDLYSLGAMLYEMVTGRLPFVGDESVAIIGQHLNTPPVSPRWHREDCPTGLEALILRLLEKDPSKRPSSAKEVRQTLEILAATPSPGDVGAAAEGEPGEGDNPSYRRTFVGRDAEVKQLQRAFDAALSGHGGLLMISGEPGVGKTAISEQLATYATLRGGRALVGHCYEEGSLSIPYLAFVEAMRAYVLERDADALRSELGSNAGYVARIVSEVRERLQITQPDEPGGEEDRWRLLQGVTAFLRNAAAVQPLMVVLEDLHWADRGTLDLLLFISRNLTGSRLLIVGTYRDVEVDRSHPLSATLAELRRIDNFQRVPLRGLTEEEVQRMMSAVAGQEISTSTASAVYRQTEGNPLFVQEVHRYLIEAGIVVREAGRWRQTSNISLVSASIPEGLRDVIGKRLQHLSESCNQVLSAAAVIGREFSLETLQRVMPIEEEALIAAIEEAERVSVLDDQSRPGVIRYRFAHAFFRQTLYEELSAPRRLQRHQQVAKALEAQFVNRLEEHAAELAEHFSQSTDPEDLAKAVRYCHMAAQQARSVFAYGEAANHLEKALVAQDVLDPDDELRRCDLLLDLSHCLLRVGETERVMQATARTAFELAEAADDHQRALDACMVAFEAINRTTGPGIVTQVMAWLERCRPYVRPDTREQVFFDAEDAARLVLSGQYGEAWKKMAAGVALADRLADVDAKVRIMGNALSQVGSPPANEPERVARAREFFTQTYPQVRGRMTDLLFFRLASALLHGGDRTAAMKVLDDEREAFELTRDAQYRSGPSMAGPILTFLDGRLGEVEASVKAAEEVMAITGRGSPQNKMYLSQALGLLGRRDEALARLEQIPPRRNALQVAQLFRAIVTEDPVAARAVLTEHREVLESGRELQLFDVLLVLENALLAGDESLVSAYQERLAPAASVTFDSGRLTSPARLLGDSAAFLGDVQSASRYYALAVDICVKVGFRPELALAHLNLAEHLLKHSLVEQAGAIEHLDFAIGEFQAMKMQPALERALRHRGLLKA